MSVTLTGGCACGAIRYAIDPVEGDPADYCHCKQCRQATGAPVAAWIQVAPSRFRVTSGEAQSYRSSPACCRWFCASCGSPLYMTDDSGVTVGILLGSLDELQHVKPTLHGWDSARIAWFDLADSLPRYPGTPPHDL
jgi:hypothetical protein